MRISFDFNKNNKEEKMLRKKIALFFFKKKTGFICIFLRKIMNPS